MRTSVTTHRVVVLLGNTCFAVGFESLPAQLDINFSFMRILIILFKQTRGQM